MVLRAPKLTFGRKMKKTIFRPKMDPEGPTPIFGQKIEITIFRPKSTLNCP